MYEPLLDFWGSVSLHLQSVEEPIRYSFWNVPKAGKYALYFGMALASLALFYGMIRRMSLYAEGKPEARLDRIPERVNRLLVYVLGQLKLARQSYGGFMHLFLFWSFMVLLMGTTLAAIDIDFMEPFGLKLLKNNLYLVYEFTLDIFGALFLLGLGMGWYRRYVVGSVKLSYDWGWAFTLGILFIINLSGFIVEGLRLAVMQPWWGAYSIVGWSLAQFFLLIGLSEETMRTLHVINWFSHYGFVAIFMAGIPYTPLMHIFTSPLNIFFARLEDDPILTRTLKPIANMEELEAWGVGKLSDFTWKQLLDFDSCTECGRCQVACPAWNAGTALNPKHLILDLRNQMLAEGGLPYSQIGGFSTEAHVNGNGYNNIELNTPLVGSVIRDETLWACTSCRACVYECPVFIEHVDAIVDMRRYLVMDQGRIPDPAAQTFRNMERRGNPWGYPEDKRMEWAEGLDVPILQKGQEVEYLYWVGCASSFDERNQKIAQSVVQLLNKAGVNYAILGQAESCNGDPARRLGNEYLYQMMAERTIESLNKHSFKKVITSCPHCFHTIGNEYEAFGGDYETIHHSEVLADLIQEGKLKPIQSIEETITYHDPCYLGRYNDVYDAPREILNAIPGLRVREMERSREKSLCCGGGGGGLFNEVHGERRINEIRLEEAVATGAEKVAAACPFCVIMFDSGVKNIEGGDQFGLEDVSELLLRSVSDKAPERVQTDVFRSIRGPSRVLENTSGD